MIGRLNSFLNSSVVPGRIVDLIIIMFALVSLIASFTALKSQSPLSLNGVSTQINAKSYTIFLFVLNCSLNLSKISGCNTLISFAKLWPTTP